MSQFCLQFWKNFLKGSFRFTAKLNGMYRELLYTCHLPFKHNLPRYQHPHQSGPFATVDDPTLIHHNHPKSLLNIKIHSWCCIYSGFGQMYNDTYWLLKYHTDYFHCSHNFHVLPIHPFPRLPATSGNHWSFYCLHNFAFSRMSFHGPIVHFFSFFFFF